MATTYIANDTQIIYETNPSIVEIAGKLATKRTKVLFKDGNKALIDASTGELAGQLQRVYIHDVEVDKEKFIKIYSSTIDELMNLTGAGLKIFKLVYRIVLDNPNIDFVYLDFNELIHFKTWSWSFSTFKTGINELLKKNIIYKAVGTHKYFINIGYFFNGDRVAVIKQYRLKQTDLFDEQDLLDNN